MTGGGQDESFRHTRLIKNPSPVASAATPTSRNTRNLICLFSMNLSVVLSPSYYLSKKQYLNHKNYATMFSIRICKFTR